MRRLLEVAGRLQVFGGEGVLAEGLGEVRRRREGPEHRRHRVGVHAPPFLPEVPRGAREAGVLRPVAFEEVGGANDERAEERPDEVDVVVAEEVLPERPQHDGGLVLLDRDDRLVVRQPWDARSCRGCRRDCTCAGDSRRR